MKGKTIRYSWGGKPRYSWEPIYAGRLIVAATLYSTGRLICEGQSIATIENRNAARERMGNTDFSKLMSNMVKGLNND